MKGVNLVVCIVGIVVIMILIMMVISRVDSMNCIELLIFSFIVVSMSGMINIENVIIGIIVWLRLSVEIRYFLLRLVIIGVLNLILNKN